MLRRPESWIDDPVGDKKLQLRELILVDVVEIEAVVAVDFEDVTALSDMWTEELSVVVVADPVRNSLIVFCPVVQTSVVLPREFYRRERASIVSKTFRPYPLGD